MAKGNRAQLSEEQFEQYKGTIYTPGLPYAWVMSYGWCIVGFYIEHLSPLVIRVAHTNHFHNANKDYGRLMQEGAGSDCEWRYEGNAEIMVPHVLRAVEYYGEVPRGRVRGG